MNILNPGTEPLTKTQDQLAQIEIKFKGPLIKNSQVETVNDLLLLSTKYHYEHKKIWVKSEKSNYYLDNGNGSELINWKKQISRVVIQQYNPDEIYQKDDTVSISGKIYKAKQDVPKAFNPLTYHGYWQVLAGETETVRYIFKNASSIIIFTEIRNPIFEAILGTFTYDANSQYVIGNDGLIELLNQEIIEPYVKKRDDILPNEGIAYEISFFSNSLPIQLTGVINIK